MGYSEYSHGVPKDLPRGCPMSIHRGEIERYSPREAPRGEEGGEDLMRIVVGVKRLRVGRAVVSAGLP